MRKPENLAGMRFGRLSVTSFVGVKCKNAYWLCRCDCGNESEVCACHLKSGKTTSCGCYHSELVSVVNLTHGYARKENRPREYGIWKTIKSRCLNPNSVGYSNYGGRGIMICDRWSDSFENFLSDMGISPTNKHTVERKDNNANYAPENCYWATYKQQANNRRGNHFLEADGRKQTISQWASEMKIRAGTIYSRFIRGWDERRAIFTPIYQRTEP